MARFGVRVDEIAGLREARRSKMPDPVAATVLVEQAGADGVVCHLREDRAHIKEKDVYLLKELVTTHLNLRIAATDELVKLALDVAPDMVTLVPETKSGVRQETGLEVNAHQEYFQDVCETLHSQNMGVSVLIEPTVHQVKAAARIGVDFVELHTGRYANSTDVNAIMDELERIRAVSMGASKLGLGVSAGSGLNYQNVRDITGIQYIEEINIGHAVISKALMVGMERAVREMLELVR